MSVFNFFVTVVEENSRIVVVKPDAFLQFVQNFEKQAGKHAQKFHTDGGAEFCKAVIQLEVNGVWISLTVWNIPDSNGFSEQTYAVIVDLSAVYQTLSFHLHTGSLISSTSQTVKITSYTLSQNSFQTWYCSNVHSKNFDTFARFVCKMLYRSPVGKLKTFYNRHCYGVYLIKQQRGWYLQPSNKKWSCLHQPCPIRWKNVSRTWIFSGCRKLVYCESWRFSR